MILYLFVEGPSDERFFKEILNARLREEYSKIKCIKMKGKTDSFIERQVRTIEKENNNYAIILDNDFGKTPRTNNLKAKYKEKARLVVNMIEGWYLAGFDERFCKINKFQAFYKDTAEVDHSKFKNSKPKNKKTEKQFLSYLLT